jgi:predicted acetyltransferase
MLRHALPVARSLGISEALVMCDTTNIASQRAIEANGGRLWDITEEKRRYWAPTQP